MEVDFKRPIFSVNRNWRWVLAALALGTSLFSCATPDPDVTPGRDAASVRPATQAGPQTTISEELLVLLSTEPNPLNLSLVLEEAYASEAEIGPEGGSLEATGRDGKVYRLTLPEGALVRPTIIRMTPVDDARGLPFTGGVVAGVELEPSGLSLLVPATLKLEFPAALPLDEVWGVSTLADGDQAALFPATYSDSMAEMFISGFSGRLIARGGRAGAKELQDRPVTSVGRRAVGYMVDILREVGSRTRQTGEIEFTGDEWLRMEALANLWETNGLEPLREAALGDDEQFLRFTYELKVIQQLERLLMAYGQSLWSTREIALMWEEPAINAIERATERCQIEHRIGEIDWIAQLVGQMQLIGLETEGTEVLDARKACAVFRLAFQSTITQRGSSSVTSNDLVMFVGGEVPELVPDLFLNQDSDLASKPSTGAIEYLEARGTSQLRGADGSVCTAKTTGGIDSTMMARLSELQIRPQRYGPWSVPEIYGPVEPPMDPQDGVTKILFDPGEPREQVTGECMGTTYSFEGDSWDQLFWLHHFDTVLDELTWETTLGGGEKPSGEISKDSGFAFALTEFEGGRRYALKSFEMCYPSTASDGGSGETCERTFFILYHQPPLADAIRD